MLIVLLNILFQNILYNSNQDMSTFPNQKYDLLMWRISCSLFGEYPAHFNVTACNG